MNTAATQVADPQTLTTVLGSALNGDGLPAGPVTVLEHLPNIQTSTFVSEIVTCRLTDGNVLRLLCKCDAGRRYQTHGHRGGVAYEAKVYRHVLEPSQVSTPRFYGTHEDLKTGGTWLILEYLQESVRVNKAPDPSAMRLAARWIGRFHAVSEARRLNASVGFLTTYDPKYYLGWMRRTQRFAGHLIQRFSWLAPLCERFEDMVRVLLAPSLTIIHGEYYPANILFRNGIIHPVDWESAAVAAGEIDLASLTEGWPEETVRQCELEYQRARWPEGAPAQFRRRLRVAQLYLHLRWLGDRPEWTAGDGPLWHVEQMRRISEQLGVT